MKMGTNKRPRIAFICDQELKDALEKWADAEGRTLSNLMERIAQNALAQHQNANVTPLSLIENYEADTENATASAFLKLLATNRRPTDSEVVEFARKFGVSVDALLKLRDRLFDK